MIGKKQEGHPVIQYHFCVCSDFCEVTTALLLQGKSHCPCKWGRHPASSVSLSTAVLLR